MWQRAQTLYLAIATILTGLMFFMDKAIIVAADGSVAQTFSFTSYIPYAILIGIVTCLNLLALTTYKIRVFQMRTAGLSAIITLALQAWLVVDFIVTGNDPLFHVTAIFPLVAVILDILAARGIWADELMVRSASRLRSSKRKKH